LNCFHDYCFLFGRLFFPQKSGERTPVRPQKATHQGASQKRTRRTPVGALPWPSAIAVKMVGFFCGLCSGQRYAKFALLKEQLKIPF
jgi:hypothetical protein